jgi:hypothetical protein
LSTSPSWTLKVFREFQAGIGERCEQGPEVAAAEPIGRFGA